MDNTEACKRMLFKAAVNHGIAPRLISERLLSNDDKEAMLEGHIAFETLDCHVMFWKAHGMPNYVNGSMAQYERYSEYVVKG